MVGVGFGWSNVKNPRVLKTPVDHVTSNAKLVRSYAFYRRDGRKKEQENRNAHKSRAKSSKNSRALRNDLALRPVPHEDTASFNPAAGPRLGFSTRGQNWKPEMGLMPDRSHLG